MNSDTLNAILILVEAAIAQEPKIQADLAAILSQANPQPADWLALRTKIAGQDYASLVPDSKIPPGQ
jgi:hypothetical protein